MRDQPLCVGFVARRAHLIIQQKLQNFQAIHPHTLLSNQKKFSGGFHGRRRQLLKVPGVESLYFIYLPLLKSITLVGGKQYMYWKAMGAHPQKDELNHTYTSWLQVGSAGSPKENRILLVVQRRDGCWMKTGKWPQDSKSSLE